MKNKLNQQQGFSIYLVMIIVSLMLSVSLNVGTIIVSSAKMSGNLSDGVRAFHSADSGIERALYNATRDCGPPTCEDQCREFVYTFFSPNFSYDVEVNDGENGSCPVSATIVSEGMYKNIKRIIEVNY